MMMRFISLLTISVLIGCETALAVDWQKVETAFTQQVPLTARTDEPGFVLGITSAQETKLVLTSGAANIEHAAKIDENSVFHIASLSKQITAAVLARAIVDKKVSLDDPVSAWIDGAEKYSDALTIKHLVYMTSGLTEYTDVERPNNLPWVTFHYFSVQDAISASLSVPELRHAPGKEWHYSNINYMLLAEIAAKAYGRPFSQLAHEFIFEPLGMTRSLVNDDITQIIPNRADGYIQRSEAVVDELNNKGKVFVKPGTGWVQIRRNAPHYGGSGVMTSMADWLRWQREMLNHDVFGEEFWRLMLQTMQFEHDKANDAFGLVHGEYQGRPTIWYSGGDIDSSSYTVSLLDAGINVSCFSNNPLGSCQDKVMTLLGVLQHE